MDRKKTDQRVGLGVTRPSIRVGYSKDRRVQRSQWGSQALGNQLEAAARREGVEHLFLTDTLGHLWGASDSRGEAGKLARRLVGQGLLSWGGARKGSFFIGSRLWARAFQVKNARLFLVARGAAEQSRGALSDAHKGVSRILQGLKVSL